MAEAFKSHTDFERVVCVVLDINLKDGSGIELRHRLKAIGIGVPVIYMTGNEDPAVRKAALASGCIAFLIKPFPVRGPAGTAQKRRQAHRRRGHPLTQRRLEPAGSSVNGPERNFRGVMPVQRLKAWVSEETSR